MNCCGRATCSTSSAAGRRDPSGRAGGLACPDRQGASGGRRLSPLSKGAQDWPGPSISTTCCCAPKNCSASLPKCARPRPRGSIICLIDEYQDTNGSQYRIVKALAAGHRNLCVVGDDDQSIYGWRGAEVTHILRFKQDWPDAKVVRLEDNYRSTQDSHVANTLIAFNSQRHDKVLAAGAAAAKSRDDSAMPGRSDEAETSGRRYPLAAEQPGARAARFRDPVSHQRAAAGVRDGACGKLNLPYVLDRRHVVLRSQGGRDILAYLKLLANPSDELSLLRIINTPARGIGQRPWPNLLAQGRVEPGKPPVGGLCTQAVADGVLPAAVDAIARFEQTYRQGPP